VQFLILGRNNECSNPERKFGVRKRGEKKRVKFRFKK